MVEYGREHVDFSVDGSPRHLLESAVSPFGDLRACDGGHLQADQRLVAQEHIDLYGLNGRRLFRGGDLSLIALKDCRKCGFVCFSPVDEARGLQFALDHANPLLRVLPVGEGARLLREALAPDLGPPLILAALRDLSHTSP